MMIIQPRHPLLHCTSAAHSVASSCNLKVYLKHRLSTAQTIRPAEGMLPKALGENPSHDSASALLIYMDGKDIAGIGKLIFAPLLALQLKTSVQNALFDKFSQLCYCASSFRKPNKNVRLKKVHLIQYYISGESELFSVQLLL